MWYLQLTVHFLIQTAAWKELNWNLVFLYYKKNTSQAEEKAELAEGGANFKCFSEQGLNIDDMQKSVTVVRPPARFNTGKNKTQCHIYVTFSFFLKLSLNRKVAGLWDSVPVCDTWPL